MLSQGERWCSRACREQCTKTQTARRREKARSRHARRSGGDGCRRGRMQGNAVKLIATMRVCICTAARAWNTMKEKKKKPHRWTHGYACMGTVRPVAGMSSTRIRVIKKEFARVRDSFFVFPDLCSCQSTCQQMIVESVGEKVV